MTRLQGKVAVVTGGPGESARGSPSASPKKGPPSQSPT